MPIGKNAIKRVENNGYSNVKTDAPDMLNSEVLTEEKPVKTQAKKRTSPAKKTTAKTSAATSKKAVKPAEEKAPVEQAVEKVGTSKKDGFKRVSVCDDMPYWLL